MADGKPVRAGEPEINETPAPGAIIDVPELGLGPGGTRDEVGGSAVEHVPSVDGAERVDAPAPPNGAGRLRLRTGRRPLAVRAGVAALVLALLASIAWGFTLNSQLTATRAELADTQTVLSDTQSDLAALQTKSAGQTACIASLVAIQEDLTSITADAATQILDRIKSGSVWATAIADMSTHLRSAGSLAADAGSAIIDGSYLLAIFDLQLAVSETKEANTAESTMNSQSSLVSSASSSLRKRIAEAESKIGDLTVCGADAVGG
jgi:hypothetical protein